MAIKATLFKVELAIADLDRHYYADHRLSIARHPSENDSRMMVRLLAFALNASDTLQFTRGLCVDEEPELWQKSDTGEIELWIELGQPELRRLRRACGRALQVVVYSYQQQRAEQWWQQNAREISALKNIRLYHFPQEEVTQLAALVSRTMQLQCTIEEGEVWLSNGKASVHLTPRPWH